MSFKTLFEAGIKWLDINPRSKLRLSEKAGVDRLNKAGFARMGTTRRRRRERAYGF